MNIKVLNATLKGQREVKNSAQKVCRDSEFSSYLYLMFILYLSLYYVYLMFFLCLSYVYFIFILSYHYLNFCFS